VRGNQRGAIKLNSSSVTLIGCEIVDNTAEPGTTAGGGIFVPNGSTVNLTRTRICGNTAPNSAQIGQNPNGVVNDLGGACIMATCDDCPLPCMGDVNADRAVDGADLGLMLSSWGTAGSADLNGDATVNGADLGILLSAWGPCD